MKRYRIAALICAVLMISGLLFSCTEEQKSSSQKGESISSESGKDTEKNSSSGDEIADNIEPALGDGGFNASMIPDFSGEPYDVVNENIPFFSESEITDVSYEYYSETDSLGRCGVCVACVGCDLMPTEENPGVGQIKPVGWHTVRYDCVEGMYLYNRCHLIGFQLAGETDNTDNLITGTRYMNVEGMLPFENTVTDYVKKTENHVMYRVTPVYNGDELIARGVLMEALSVEDGGKGISFNVFCFNVQPGVEIDYSNGESREIEKSYEPEGEIKESDTTESVSKSTPVTIPDGTTYVLNTNTEVFHYPTCRSVDQMAEKNRAFSSESRDVIIDKGYRPCKICNP